MGIKEKQEEIKASKGAVLKEARKGKGLSLEMIHEATNIPMDVLRGIEEGYQVRTISSFYYKGFLKLYAKYLDVDIKNVLEDHQKEQLPKYVKRDVEDFYFQEWVSQLLTRKQKQQIVVVIGGVLSLFLFFKIISIFIHKPSSGKEKGFVKKAGEVIKKETPAKKNFQEKKIRQKSSGNIKRAGKVFKKEKFSGKKFSKTVKRGVKKEQAKNVQTRVTTAVEKKINSVNLVKTATAPSTPVQSVRKNVTLTVRAKKSSWLRVKSDGVVVFQSTLRLGSVETWMADEKIEISGRNINQLEFELNGKMIGSLGRKDRGAKGLIITKDGLRVINKG